MSVCAKFQLPTSMSRLVRLARVARLVRLVRLCQLGYARLVR